MPPLGDRFRVVQSAEMGEVSDSVFLAAIHDRGLKHLRRDAWPTSKRRLDELGEPLLLETDEHHSGGVWELDGGLVRASIGGGWFHARVAGNETSALEASVQRLRKLFPAPDPSSSREVPVTFWTYSQHGPMPAPRTIAVPEWDEISANYAARTRDQLAAVMRDFRPAHGGQLVLWHGSPGTGKTFALRALAWEWREWCQIHYIVDPDSFFGQHADYLMNVLMQPGIPMMAFSGGVVGSVSISRQVVMHGEDLEDEDEAAEKAWRLLVLEDTGELLTPDAKSVIGQGLSRFLNVVDGLIGQGLRVLVLVTTNEPIRQLHPAVARPGRAAANIEFVPLSRAEADDWLRAHDVAHAAADGRTIASLYAELEGRDPATARSVGFADIS